MRSDAMLLSNGLTRTEYLKTLQGMFIQPPIKYPKQAGEEWLDIPYANTSNKQKMNIYVPEGEGRFPTLIWIHGGGWFMGDRSDFALSYAFPFLKHGYAVVSVGYRLADEAIFPDPVKDVMLAVSYLKKHASEYLLDEERFAVISGSAGTNIAALAALKADIADTEQDYSVKVVILKCSILDFASIRKQFEEIGISRKRFSYPDEDTSIEALYLGGTIQECEEKCNASNPARYLKSDSPPFLLMHGLDDVDTPYLQSVEFANEIKATAGADKVKLILFQDTGHDNGMYDLDSTFELQLDFLRKHLNKY